MGEQRSFLDGGGEATRLILARDWSAHPLGPPERWPDDLKVALSLVLNSPESMILAWGPELHFFFNEAYFPLLGPRLPWAMGERFDKVWADGWDQARPIIDAAFEGRKQAFVDLPWKLDTDRGAADTWWSFSYSRVLDARGGIAGLFIFTNETTERVLGDAALRASEEQLRLLVDNQRMNLQQMPGFVALLGGPQHVYRYVNDAYVAIAGRREFEGRPVREVFPELAGQGFFELLDAVYASGEPFSSRAMPLRLAGEDEDRYIDFLYQPIRDAAGAVTGIFVGGYDITVRVRAERALERANATLEERIARALTEQAATEEALRQSQKMEAVGQLTGGIAHDFNNLLAGISGSLDIVQRRLQQGRVTDIDRYLGVAREATRRAALLTHRLLAFSRRQTLDPKPTDANALVGGMAELLRRSVGPGIQLEIDATPAPWPVLVDASQLENALLNLCINARDAMPHGGRIVIETSNLLLDQAAAQPRDLEAGEYVLLSVADTGAGMAPEVIVRAFEPFFTTKPLGEGTGLGLSMVYGFVRQSGGQVRIVSEPGVGSTVFMYLPRHRGDLPAGEVEAPAPAAHRATAAPRTVFVVDDEPSVRLLLVDLLGELGYVTIEAADSLAGLTVLQSDTPIDLLITDVGLPGGMNGRQMAEAGMARRPGLKVLFITGYAENAALGDGRLETGMAVLTKPFSIDALAARVAELLAGD